MRRQESAARFSGPVSKSHAANMTDVSVQTTITEIQMLNRLRKKSRSVFSALVKMTARLEQLKDALAQQRDKHMAERVADMYREYQLRVAYIEKRHEQRREQLKHTHDAELAEFLTKARGDWVLSFQGQYQSEIDALNAAYDPIETKARKLVVELERQCGASSRKINGLSTRCVELEKEVSQLRAAGSKRKRRRRRTRKSTSASSGVQDGDEEEKTSTGSASPGESSDEEVEARAERDEATRDKMQHLAAIVLNSSLTEAERSALTTQEGAASFNAPRKALTDVKSQLDAIVGYNGTRSALILRNQLVQNRREVEEAVRVQRAEVKAMQASFNDVRLAHRSFQLRINGEEEKIRANKERVETLEAIKRARLDEACLQVAGEQRVLMSLVPDAFIAESMIRASRKAAARGEAVLPGQPSVDNLFDMIDAPPDADQVAEAIRRVNVEVKDAAGSRVSSVVNSRAPSPTSKSPLKSPPSGLPAKGSLLGGSSGNLADAVAASLSSQLNLLSPDTIRATGSPKRSPPAARFAGSGLARSARTGSRSNIQLEVELDEPESPGTRQRMPRTESSSSVVYQHVDDADGSSPRLMRSRARSGADSQALPGHTVGRSRLASIALDDDGAGSTYSDGPDSAFSDDDDAHLLKLVGKNASAPSPLRGSMADLKSAMGLGRQ